MPTDHRLVRRVVLRHLGEPSKPETVVEDVVARQHDLLSTLLDCAREIDQLRWEAHEALDSQDENPLEVLSRIAVRRRAAVVLRDVPHDGVEVIHSDGGIVTAHDVARLLEPRVGVLKEVRFIGSAGAPNAVGWSATNPDGETISGRLLLHAGVRGNTQVVSWAEIVIEGEPVDGRAIRCGSESDAEIRLRQIASRARLLIAQIRNNEVGWRDVVGALVSIVEVAEK